MEFGNIGQHCAFGICKQQDFLPFECDGCKKIFCTDHTRADDHKCSLPSDYDSVYVIICPICEQRIKMQVKEDPNVIWNNHSASGKCVPKQSNENKPARKCMANKCYAKLNPINSVTCGQCCKEVCLKHRYEDDHQCTKLIRNKQVNQSNLLKPGFIQSQMNNQQPAQVNNQQEYASLMSKIDQFSSASAPQKVQKQDYQPEACEVCGSLFRDTNELIAHTEAHFKDFMQTKQTETQKCPHCPMRFAVTELVTHLQQDHFIF